MRLKDLTGKRFERLTVINRSSNVYTTGGNSKVMWNCICDCGNNTIVCANALLTGKTKSCGCLNREESSNRLSDYLRKKNVFRFNDDYVIGFTSKNQEFYFDKDDYDLVSQYCWYEHHGYIAARDITSKNSRLYLHRLVTRCPDNKIVDHINHNKNDCRKKNLRICTYSENNINVKKNNEGKYGKGITYRKKKNTYEVYININHKRVYVGSSHNIDEAIRIRNDAENKYYGEYRYKSSMAIAEQIKL